MTAVEWFDEQIQERTIAQDVVARKLIIEISMEDYMDIKKHANKMFEQQIIDAHDMGYIDGGNHKKVTAKQYYNETYGSKGSDEHKYYEQSRGVNVDSFQSVAPKKQDYIVKVTDVTSSQTEISDEEIEKIPLEDALNFTEWMSSLINSNYKSGGNWYHKGEIVTTKKLYEKWYREQLKQKL